MPPHLAWGYHYASKKGTALLRATQNHHLVLQNNLNVPTRTGTSVSRDTIPDLTFTRHCPTAQWHRLDENLGSDHYLITLRIPFARKPLRKGTARLTNWDNFRKDPTSSPPIGPILDDWVQALEQRVCAHTQSIALTDATPAADPHLLHMWDARRSLSKRWKRQRYNQPLRKRIPA